MISIKEIFSKDVVGAVSWWLPDGADSADLIGAAESAAEMEVRTVSVVPSDVKIIWPWVEKLKIKLLPRFYVDSVNSDSVSDLAVKIKSEFKNGAHGAQVIIGLCDVGRFVDSIISIRDDLFFNKDLSMGIDVFQVWPLDWGELFANLKRLHASSLLLILSHDDMERSDFTGRIYAALQSWDANSDMELHVMLGESYARAEQVYRLVAINRPELLNKLKFFVSY